MPEDRGESYLGDGLYASFDGWCIWLRAPRPGGEHLVALDPEVMAALVRFAAGLSERFPGQDVPVWEALQRAALDEASR